MEESDERICYLMDRFFRNACSQMEKEELAYWIERSWNDEEMKRHLSEIWSRFEPMEDMSEARANEVFASIVNAAPSVVRWPQNTRRRWLSGMAAACVALLAGAGTYFFLLKESTHSIEAAIVRESEGRMNDAAPGQAKAVLTLSNGSQILLDTVAGNQVIAEQGNSKVINTNGRLLYSSPAHTTKEILYNTLWTHRGEQYSMTLSDGTKLWLNAASSIRFPVAFSGNQRVVEITGEVYFEVAHNKEMPFRVKAGDEIIEVIGTHFNINAYEDETHVKTTLIEGSVKVSLGASSVLLKPDEQAVVKTGSTEINVSPADGQAAIAWKNGYFKLTNSDVASIVRQISRWYDVEVVYKGAVPAGTISGEVPRNLNLSEVLQVLDLSGIRCRLEGQKLIVSD